ncbi:hypothetical protein [Lacticaseibacillus absianus]|nr:hypothetical protein [Lacticaseibacillus absianus]
MPAPVLAASLDWSALAGRARIDRVAIAHILPNNDSAVFAELPLG